MKIIVTIIFVFTTLMTFSQSSYQITDSTKIWNTVWYGAGSWNIVYCGGIKTNKIEHEVTIGNQIYFEVFESVDSNQSNWTDRGFIREDTINKLVYFHEGFDDEGLIYDFSLDIGDSVIIDNYYVGFENVLLICDSIDSININGVLKKRLFLYSPGFWDSDIWIEGIGSKFGLLYSGFNGSMMAGGSADLLCCSKNDTLIYMDSVYNSCYIEEFYPKITSEYFDTAYANNYYEFQVQVSDTINIDSFSLIGEVIPVGFNFNEETGLLSGMPMDTGSFPCIITIKNYDIGFKTDMLYENIKVELLTKIQSNLDNFRFTIYPNPIRSFLQIRKRNINNEPYVLEIYNFSGKLIFKQNILKSNFKLNCSNYKNGIYILKITDLNENNIFVKKIIKQ